MQFTSIKEYKETLIRWLDLELEAENAQVSAAHQSIALARKMGFSLFPIRITNRGFGLGEYPELIFQIPPFQSTDRFKTTQAIELFSESGESFKGNLVYLNDKEAKIRLFANDFPEILDSEKVGIRIGVDEKSIQTAKDAISALAEDNEFLDYLIQGKNLLPNGWNLSAHPASQLNESQNRAVKECLSNEKVTIIHGPPGTGKTTTLVEAVKQMTEQGHKVIATAPSNMAVDHLALSLIAQGVEVLRIGNTVKVSEELLAHTIDGKLSEGAIFHELKKLKIQAEEFRHMASQYKRSYGKEERQQRKLIWEHYKSLKEDIKKTINYYKDKWKNEAQVICGTPVGLAGELAAQSDFKVLVIDEAGQCLQPFGWIVLQPYMEKVILAGDPFQLPPTVISEEAMKEGFDTSFLELFLSQQNSHLLDTQYRMKARIAGFSNQYFYQNKLITPDKLHDNQDESVLFYDTVGTGYQEEREAEGSSYFNKGELELIQKIIAHYALRQEDVALISPYSGQVKLANEMKIPVARISSIDSFQGQEHPVVIISLVRSNENREIGFLKDYRRMNVALTRAQNRLIVVGDSLTLGNDKFYQSFIDFIEENQGYHSAWELI